AQQRAQRAIDGGELLGQRSGVTTNRFETIRDGGHALPGVEEGPGDRNEVPREREHHEGDRDQRQRQEHGGFLTSSALPARWRQYRASAPRLRPSRASHPPPRW